MFGYDDLHRVTSRTIGNYNNSSGYAALPAGFKLPETYTYDVWGNIKSKTGIGHYCYDTSKTNRLTAVWSGASCTGTQQYTLGYDNNGNVSSDGKHTFTYTAFDKPSRISKGSNYTDFAYGPDRQLYRRTDVRNSQTTDSFYIDGLYERVTLPSGVIEHKFYVGNAVITKRSNNAHDELYLHKDNQGSTISISNSAGTVLQQFIYDPWGRQYSVSTNSLFSTYSNPGTSKGYTSHNMVNDFEVIHMGGRTYNPHLGRFMQADPFVQAPGNLQNYNRYSYVLNNPMSYTDPSGYFFDKLARPFKKIGRNLIRAAVKVFGAELVNFVGSVISTVYGGALGAAAWSYDFNRAMGASSSGALRSAAIAGASAWAFSRIGQYYDAQTGSGSISFGGNELTAGQVAGQITAHAMVGGVTASLQGGKFGHGFFSAGVTKGFGGALLPGGAEINSTAELAQNTVISAMIGGTASVVAGGKFANGARTAAMQYLMNQVEELIKQQLTALSSEIHNDAKNRMHELSRWRTDKNWDAIRAKYPVFNDISDNNMFVSSLALQVEFQSIAYRYVGGYLSNSVMDGVNRIANLSTAAINPNRLNTLQAIYAFISGPPPPPFQHQFVATKVDRVSIEIVRRR